MWFEQLMGFTEESPSQVRSNIRIQGEEMTSLANGETYRFGQLSLPTLAELRDGTPDSAPSMGRTRVSEVVANVQDLHVDPKNAGALFQVASQFNLLEMVSPSVSPEQGIDRYEHDHTQGPACAIAAGAGTIYRNYFVPVNGEIGQNAEHQIDCLAGIGQLLGNDQNRLWTMRNGYALPSESGLRRIDDRLSAMSPAEVDQVRAALQIGVHSRVQVTLSGCEHTVSQAYCSALPVAYSGLPVAVWERFARIVLEASYEATFWAALKNRAETDSNILFLTLLGGGAFGNREAWIHDAIIRALSPFKTADLDVRIVSYGQPHPLVTQVIQTYAADY